MKKAIFTFVHIPDRLSAVDVPKISREVEQPVLVMALKYASDTDLANSANFLLENMSKRMSDAIREEMAELGAIKPKDGEGSALDTSKSAAYPLSYERYKRTSMARYGRAARRLYPDGGARFCLMGKTN